MSDKESVRKLIVEVQEASKSYRDRRARNFIKEIKETENWVNLKKYHLSSQKINWPVRSLDKESDEIEFVEERKDRFLFEEDLDDSSTKYSSDEIHSLMNTTTDLRNTERQISVTPKDLTNENDQLFFSIFSAYTSEYLDESH